MVEEQVSTLLTHLIEGVDTTPPHAPASAWSQLLRTHAADRATLGEDLIHYISSHEEELGKDARETTTHYVWRLHSARPGGPGIYLNEFKELDRQTPGYAKTVHNHRYNFAALVLHGGYTQETYHVELHGQTLDRALVERGVSTSRLSAGQWNEVEHQSFHRIVNVAPSTFTLLLKGAPHLEYSLSVDERTGVVRRHIPVEARASALGESLSRALNVQGGRSSQGSPRS